MAGNFPATATQCAITGEVDRYRRQKGFHAYFLIAERKSSTVFSGMLITISMGEAKDIGALLY
jgi:hypothetical protein